MPKKRIFLIGFMLFFCLCAQWLLRNGQAAVESPESTSTSDTQSSEQKGTLFSDTEKTEDQPDTADLRHQLIKQLITMIFFVALIGAAVWWFARRYSKGLMGGKGRLITVTETVPLGPRKQVHIIQVGPRRLLLGSTADSIRFLADVTDAIEIPVSGRAERGQSE